MNIPGNLIYTQTDEWLLVEGNTATLGITDYAQNQLSDIVFVEIIVDKGQTIKKLSQVATIESVKAAADVNIPVSAKILEINSSLPDTPELINSDPFGKAWILKLELLDANELSGLMDAKAYTDFCTGRGH